MMRGCRAGARGRVATRNCSAAAPRSSSTTPINPRPPFATRPHPLVYPPVTVTARVRDRAAAAGKPGMGCLACQAPRTGPRRRVVAIANKRPGPGSRAPRHHACGACVHLSILCPEIIPLCPGPAGQQPFPIIFWFSRALGSLWGRDTIYLLYS